MGVRENIIRRASVRSTRASLNTKTVGRTRWPTRADEMADETTLTKPRDFYTVLLIPLKNSIRLLIPLRVLSRRRRSDKRAIPVGPMPLHPCYLPA